MKTCTPTISTGPCPPTIAGPYAAWMPRKSLHGRTCGVSRDGRRARALQPNRRSTALHLIYPHRPTQSIQPNDRVVASDRCRQKLSGPGARCPRRIRALAVTR
ncbi:hypothetical protein E1J24_13060 [Xanthomonas hortorum pv. pelargonii]|uniref:Uncharacterized protein n=1 Tax=Xanthomonas hortorum pv. pelargonii TaxID=453602 RepID=A0AAW9ZV23_9XANT|nr:hypothetical protein [Xanthomonas hortorum pv. pelargonii]